MQRQKQYVLGMFPYPSGEGLHVGHVRIYTACDVMARYFKMKGYEVLSPMGWDAFGLPAENAAIKNKTNPADIVPKNYNNFRAQMKNLSFDFDWSRELATTDPTYYGLTQWIFLQLYGMRDAQGKRLVYREQVPINWCPKCKTGIANEEVLSDGTHERCGTVTGKKMLPQWVMRITSYAEELLAGLDQDLSKWFGQPSGSDLEGRDLTIKSLDWPRGILEMQRNWIGKKEGARVKFGIKGSELRVEEIEVFTTRIDTIDGVTFIVVAPEKAQKWMEEGWQASASVREYVEAAIGKTEQLRLEGEKDKTGVATGLYAINPLTQEEVPIWVADYVLAEFGTGCVMGVPQYDERDAAFAKKHQILIKDLPLLDYEATFAKLSAQGLAQRETTYHLRDWVFSRQRYWGEPIPLVYCANCAINRNQEAHLRQGFGGQAGNSDQSLDIVEMNDKKYAVVSLTEKDLPLELPYLESYEPTDTGESPLARVAEWVTCKCPKCGGEARRETDTMPNWAGSCWYFLAYPFWKSENPSGSDLEDQSREQDSNDRSTQNILEEYKRKSETPYSDFWREVATPAIEQWLPADWYLGGAEHAVLHLLYARFWVKVLYDLKLLSFQEPFLRLRSVGMVLAEDGRKMSKSWGNVINPDDVVRQYGSDAVRLYEMFMGPWDQAIAWDTRALIGQQRFLERVQETAQMPGKVGAQSSPKMLAQLAKLLAQVERGIVEQKFNTCIAGMMETVNLWRSEGECLAKKELGILSQVLSPFAPQAARNLWLISGNTSDPASSPWPELDAVSLEETTVKVAVQVNGKMRGIVECGVGVAKSEEEVVKLALALEGVQKHLSGEPRKVIFVPGKIVNLVG